MTAANRTITPVTTIHHHHGGQGGGGNLRESWKHVFFYGCICKYWWSPKKSWDHHLDRDAGCRSAVVAEDPKFEAIPNRCVCLLVHRSSLTRTLRKTMEEAIVAEDPKFEAMGNRCVCVCLCIVPR